MKSNILIKMVAGAIPFLLIFIMVKANSEDPRDSENIEAELTSLESGPLEVYNGLDIDPLKDDFLEDEYGVDVDTPVETMRTLTKETQAVRENSIKLQEENGQLREEIKRLLDMEQVLNERVSDHFSKAEVEATIKQKEMEDTQSTTMTLISNLKDKMETLKEGKPKDGRRAGIVSGNGYDIESAGIPAGLGYGESSEGLAYGDVDYGITNNNTPHQKVIWIDPLDARVDPEDPTKISLPDFAPLAQEVGSTLAAGDKPPSIVRAYTIPQNGTLLGSISMTAMLGRIPVNGQVLDPYPFKLIVGEENLSSNGITIPDVVGIKMSGVAKGDWTLSCVSGNITSMTFTFRDGTIVTYPDAGAESEEPIAWFSDKYGIPCIKGDRITNAPSYLSQRVALSASASYANADAQSGIVTQQTGDTLTSGITDPKRVARNSAVSEGLNQITDWIGARQANSFDAIYIPPGEELAIHITQELKIDYDPNGRKVNHYANISQYSDSHLD